MGGGALRDVAAGGDGFFVGERVGGSAARRVGGGVTAKGVRRGDAREGRGATRASANRRSQDGGDKDQNTAGAFRGTEVT